MGGQIETVAPSLLGGQFYSVVDNALVTGRDCRDRDFFLCHHPEKGSAAQMMAISPRHSVP